MQHVSCHTGPHTLVEGLEPREDDGGGGRPLDRTLAQTDQVRPDAHTAARGEGQGEGRRVGTGGLQMAGEVSGKQPQPEQQRNGQGDAPGQA